jgi:hypothetical protein
LDRSPVGAHNLALGSRAKVTPFASVLDTTSGLGLRKMPQGISRQ